MKKSILFICVCIILNQSLLIQNSFGQWQVSTGIGNIATINDIELNGSYIFAGTYQGVFRSSDNGSNWTQCQSIGSVNTLAKMGTILFAGTQGPGAIYRSSNYGASWDSISLISYSVTSLASSDMYLFAGSTDWMNENNGLRRSADSGKTWITCFQWRECIFPSIATNASNIFAGSCSIYRSTDYGTTWNITFGELALSLITNGSIIYAGTDQHGVYISVNNGLLWTQSGLSNRSIYSLSVYSDNIFAGSTSGYGVFHTSNNGTNWVQKNEGFGVVPKVNALLIVNGYLLAGTEGRSVWRRPLSDFVGIKPISNNLPEKYSLSQNYPNPFNPSTKIKFQIPNSKLETNSKTKIRIYDALGREIVTLVNEQLLPGVYEVEWYATNYPSGVYFYKLTTGEFSDIKKMILVK